jgi:hypothetical protein
VLKRLTILAVFLTVAQAFVPATGQASTSPRNDGQKQDNGRDSNKKPTQAATNVVGQDKSGSIQKSEPEETPSDHQRTTIIVTNPAPVSELWSWHDKVAWGAGLILLVVAAVTLRWFIIQTNATKDAAEAALLNVKALIISERPWIVVVRKKKPALSPDKCIIVGINKGNTPAEVCGIYASVVTQEDVSEVEPPDPLDSYVLPKNALTISGERFQIKEISFDWCSEQLKAKPRKIMRVFVEVQYWDKFTDRKQPGVKPYITRCCFCVDPSKRELYRYAVDWTCNT